MSQIKENFRNSDHVIHVVNSFDQQDFIELSEFQRFDYKNVTCREEHANESHNYRDHKILNCQHAAPSNCFTQSVIFALACHATLTSYKMQCLL